MKFREYGDVTPKVITAETPIELTKKIEQVGREFDIIDLQYSTAMIGGFQIRIQFSALLLIRERKAVKRRGRPRKM